MSVHIPPMPTNWTPSQVLDNNDRYNDLFTRESDPHEAWNLYCRRRMGLPPDQTSPQSDSQTDHAVPVQHSGTHRRNPLADIDPQLVAAFAFTLGIDPSQIEGLQNLFGEDLENILGGFGIQIPQQQPPIEETAPQVHATAQMHIPQVQEGPQRINGWPIRERYLVLNPLSQFWTWEAVREDPSRIGSLAVYYAFGIVGYAFALPFRIAVFAKELFHLPCSFFHNLCVERGENFFRTMKVRLLCFLGASGELVSGIVGLACPPVAYWLDEKIQDNSIIHDHSRIRGMRVERGRSLGQIIENAVTGNMDRLDRKAELIRPFVPRLQRGVQKLSEYYNEEAVKGAAPKTLEQIAMLGFLFSFRESLRSDPHAEFLGALNTFIAEYLPDVNFGEHKRAYLTEWERLTQVNNPVALVDFLILSAVQDAAAEDALSLGDEDFLEGKKDELARDLNLPLANQNFRALYDAMRSMSNAVIHSDHELMQVIANKSGLQG